MKKILFMAVAVTLVGCGESMEENAAAEAKAAEQRFNETKAEVEKENENSEEAADSADSVDLGKKPIAPLKGKNIPTILNTKKNPPKLDSLGSGLTPEQEPKLKGLLEQKIDRLPHLNSLGSGLTPEQEPKLKGLLEEMDRLQREKTPATSRRLRKPPRIPRVPRDRPAPAPQR